MTATKFKVKNLLDHTVILKINGKVNSIHKGNEIEVSIYEGKDVLLFPNGSLEFTKVELKSESEPKVTEKKETVENEETEKTVENEVTETSEATEKPKTTKKASSRKTPVKGAKSKSSDVKIETEEK